MNDATLPSLRKLKDNNGAYIWQPAYQAGGPDRILGYKVETSAYAPKDGIALGITVITTLETVETDPLSS